MRYVICLSLFLSACTVKTTQILDGKIGNDGHNSLIGIISNNPACSSGGTLITSGLDLNDNGVLDLIEIQNGADVCNGVSGSNGLNGNDGAPGADGKDGEKGDTGSDGSQGPKGDKGDVGNTGPQGSKGDQGNPGLNGSNGKDGSNANVSPFLPIAAIQPCGANSSSYKEVLLGMSGGYIFAEFTGGSSTNDVRNAFIPDGNYQDTDSSHCNFSVVTSGNGNRVVAWSGGSAVYTNATKSWVVSY